MAWGFPRAKPSAEPPRLANPAGAELLLDVLERLSSPLHSGIDVCLLSLLIDLGRHRFLVLAGGLGHPRVAHRISWLMHLAVLGMPFGFPAPFAEDPGREPRTDVAAARDGGKVVELLQKPERAAP